MGNTSITPGQKKQFLRFVEDAAERALGQAGLDKDNLQRLIGNGGEFQSDILTSIKRLSVSNRFADEEVESDYVYPRDYKVKGINEQGRILKCLFSGLGCPDDGLVSRPLPAGAEGWFAIPRWQSLAPTYGEAVEKVLAMIRSKRKFYNYRDGQLGAEYLQQHAKTAKMFQTLGDQQKDYNILVVAAQFGLRHGGRSVRMARDVMNSFEFGLGAFAVGIMLLTHPERLVDYEDLWIDCAGDEFSTGADGRFGRAPIFNFFDGRLEFGADWSDSADESYGSASGFLPQ